MELKKLFSDVIGAVSEKGRAYAGTAVDKTKTAGKVAKLTLELASEKENLRKTYAEIGQAYYESDHDSADGLLAQLCAEADAVKARIEGMEQELAENKANLSAPIEPDVDVEVTFDDVVSEDEKQAVEEAAEKVEETVDCVIDAAEDALADAAEAVSDLADNVIDKAEEAADKVEEFVDNLTDDKKDE